MNITRIALENSRTTLVILFALLISGYQAYVDMPRAYDPGFIIRVAQVITYFPGASPERVEELVSDRIEKVVQEIPELDFVKSENRTGVSIVLVNVKESYKQMRPIWDSLRRKIDKVKGELPAEVIGPEVNDEFGDVFGIVMTITGDGYSYTELDDVAEEVRDELLLIDQVAKVDIYGKQEERIFVEYNNARLTELNLSPSQLSSALASTNIVISGGAVTLADERIEIEPTGNFESLEDIGNTTISLPGVKQVLRLSDIATIERGYIDPPSTMVHSSGVPSLALAISMIEGGNNILLGQQYLETIERLLPSYPIGIEFDTVSFSPLEVENKVNDFVSNLVQAIIVVALVMLVSLGLRTGMVVSSLIPMSMVFAIFVMSLFGIGLDQISLAALIIALGMLVDNGIVMSENIMVRMQSGQDATEAAVDSAAELRVPLLTSSLTTAAAFLPIFLAESATGEFTASLFKVVTITLLSSWLLSLTVIPLFCVMFLRVKQEEISFSSRFYVWYRGTLNLMLRHQLVVLLISLVLFVVSLQGLKLVPNIFFPPSDRLYFTMEVELPPGSSIYRTQRVVEQIETYIDDTLMATEETPGVTSWISHIGSGGPRFVLSHNAKAASTEYALMVINATDAVVIGDLMKRLDAFVFDQLPDVRTTLKRIESGPSIKNPIEFRILGRESDELYEIVDALKAMMAADPGIRNINDDWGPRIKKLVVNVNPQRALRAGVTNQDIAVSLQTGMSGLELSEYREGTDSIPIILRSSRSDQEDFSRFQSLSVFSQSSGTAVDLLQVASIDVVWQASKILRRDRLKTISVGAQPADGYTAAQGFDAIVPWLEEQQQSWPNGYRFELGGESETSGKANQSIADKLPIAVFIILILLVGQFNSLRKSAIVLSAIPLAMIGVTSGLLVFQSYFGFITLLGIISLAGIVINNAIVLLERIKIEIEDNGLPPHEAIVEAAQRRLRPILLTTATTVLGLIPLYLGGGEFWEPMAVTIIAGLLFSTMLTLGVVPILYALLFRIKLEDHRT